MISDRCCYVSTVQEFQKQDPDTWLKTMKEAFGRVFVNYPLDDEQIMAWVDCFPYMQKALKDAEQPESNYIVFEYKLPQEGGRRPDVLLISASTIVVIEFKMHQHLERTDFDQLVDYCRDLQNYHVASRNMKIIRILVSTGAKGLFEKRKNVHVRSGDQLHFGCHSTEPFDIDAWIHSAYEPLPTILDAARQFASGHDLPQIKQAESAGIPQALECLHTLAQQAHDNKEHILVFVTGVPGAGKTLLGLQLVYREKEYKSIFLSGNDPLVEVLRDALSSKTFVNRLHNVLSEPEIYQNIVVFDEGQRAWDREQVKAKRGEDKTEPDKIIELMEKSLDWGLLLVLVGEGQEINKGEHAGLKPWLDALTRAWKVVCPPKLDSMFNSEDAPNREHLDLTVSLRSHLAGQVSTCINHIIEGEWEPAEKLMPGILDEEYNLFITRDLELAKRYCIQTYEISDTKRYGMLSSSKACKYKVEDIQRGEYGPWYNRKPGEPGAGGNFQKLATEFSCQGLELDFPILRWGKDMLWTPSGWKTNQDWDPEKRTYRLNSYRVLLTRGRDGCILYFPPEKEYDETYQKFKEIGVPEL